LEGIYLQKIEYNGNQDINISEKKIKTKKSKIVKSKKTKYDFDLELDEREENDDV